MSELVRSRAAMGLVAVAALFAALSDLLLGIGYLTLTHSSQSAFSDLATGSAWVLFVAALVALVAICTVGWSLLLRGRWTALCAVALAGIATLIFTIGVLLLAFEVNSNSNAGNVVAAIGVGTWALLAAAVAARRSISQHAALSSHRATTVSTSEPVYWIVVAGSLVVVAVAFGLPGPTFQDATPGVVAGILGALGVAAIAIVLAMAKSHRLLGSTAVVVLVIGLVVYALSRLVYGISAAVVFSPSATLTSFKVWTTITAAIELVAWLVIGSSAWLRVGELSVPEETGRTRPVTAFGGGGPTPGWDRPQTAGTPNHPDAYAMPAPAPPAGWYPDPQDATRSRWWDGRAWTDHLAPPAGG